MHSSDVGRGGRRRCTSLVYRRKDQVDKERKFERSEVMLPSWRRRARFEVWSRREVSRDPGSTATVRAIPTATALGPEPSAPSRLQGSCFWVESLCPTKLPSC
jgi:hypothetical protein